MSQSVTIKDVARLAGVSTASVSYFLNGKRNKLGLATQQRIGDAIRQTGYVPNARARILVRAKTMLVGVLVFDVTNPLVGLLCKGVEHILADHGYRIILCNTHGDPAVERSYVEQLMSLGVDGFIVQPTSNFKAVADQIERAGSHVVFVDSDLYDFDVAWVKSSLYNEVYQTMLACADRGYHHFVIVESGMLSAASRVERHRGFMDAVLSCGLTYSSVEVEEGGIEVGRLGSDLSEVFSDDGTLVFIPHRWAVVPTFQALQPLLRYVPRRLGIVGMNCLEWSELASPSITTINEPFEQEGVLASELLVAMLDKSPVSVRQHIVPCETVWRDSTRR